MLTAIMLLTNGKGSLPIFPFQTVRDSMHVYVIACWSKGSNANVIGATFIVSSRFWANFSTSYNTISTDLSC